MKNRNHALVILLTTYILCSSVLQMVGRSFFKEFHLVLFRVCDMLHEKGPLKFHISTAFIQFQLASTALHDAGLLTICCKAVWKVTINLYNAKNGYTIAQLIFL